MNSKLSRIFLSTVFFTLMLSSRTTSPQILQKDSLNIALIDVSQILEFRYKQDIGPDAEKKYFRSIPNLLSNTWTQPVNDIPIYKELFRQAFILYELQSESECLVSTQDKHHPSYRYDVYDFAVCAYLERQAHYLKEINSIFQTANEESEQNSLLAKTFGYQIVFSKEASNEEGFVFTCGHNPLLESPYNFTDIKCSDLVSPMSGEDLLMLKALLNLVTYTPIGIDVTEKVIAYFKNK